MSPASSGGPFGVGYKPELDSSKLAAELEEKFVGVDGIENAASEALWEGVDAGVLVLTVGRIKSFSPRTERMGTKSPPSVRRTKSSPERRPSCRASLRSEELNGPMTLPLESLTTYMVMCAPIQKNVCSKE